MYSCTRHIVLHTVVTAKLISTAPGFIGDLMCTIDEASLPLVFKRDLLLSETKEFISENNFKTLQSSKSS